MTARSIALALLTPLLEKNVLKTLTFDLPVVFSMSRVIVLGAIERLKPQDAFSLVNAVVGRFGTGEAVNHRTREAL